MIGVIDEYLSGLVNTLELLDRAEIIQFSRALLETRKQDKRIYVFGNGGSASTASHFAVDLNKGCARKDQKGFMVIPLTDNVPTILAYANDACYEDIFVAPLRNFLEPGDLVIGISGSGNSENVLRAVRYANEAGNRTVGLTGYDGGELRRIAWCSVNANVNDMQMSEDVHMVLVHLMMKISNAEMSGSVRSETA